MQMLNAYKYLAGFSLLSGGFKHMLAFLIFWLTSARRSRHCRRRCQAAFFYNCLCMRKPRRMCRQNWLVCISLYFAYESVLPFLSHIVHVATCLFVLKFPICIKVLFFPLQNQQQLSAARTNKKNKECNSHLCSIKSNLKERKRSYWERTVTWQCQIKQYIFYISSTFLTTNTCTDLCDHVDVSVCVCVFIA